MSFLIYFFVLLVSAASVLFGLDLMSSPLPNTPNVPIGRSVQVVSPPAQRETRAADERALTPVYPTEPGKPKVQAETSGATPQDNASLTLPSAQPKVEPATAAQPALQQSARLPKPQQTARQSTGKGAMGGAERIAKRQPLQLMPSAPQTMAPAEMSESERIVRRMTRNESGDIPVQDGDGNIIIVRKSYR